MNTLNRAVFARASVPSGNATQAAIDAGHSPKTAKQQSTRLLTEVGMALAIEAEHAMLRERLNLRAFQNHLFLRNQFRSHARQLTAGGRFLKRFPR